MAPSEYRGTFYMARRRSMSADPRYCHICGFPIPNNIVSSQHPLFGTIDHVIPLAAGGRDVLTNRKPAHNWCNGRKGSQLEPLHQNKLASIQGQVVVYLKRAGHPHIDKKLKEARRRIGLNIPTKTERILWSETHPQNYAIIRWEGDGGAPIGDCSL